MHQSGYVSSAKTRHKAHLPSRCPKGRTNLNVCAKPWRSLWSPIQHSGKSERLWEAVSSRFPPEGDSFPAVRGLPPGAQPQRLQGLWRDRLTAAHGAHHALRQPFSGESSLEPEGLELGLFSGRVTLPMQLTLLSLCFSFCKIGVLFYLNLNWRFNEISSMKPLYGCHITKDKGLLPPCCSCCGIGYIKTFLLIVDS